MSARDDYPAIAVHSRWDGQEGQECRDALKEIDYLRRWQTEMIAVVSEWEKVWEAAGRPGPLGGSKAQNLLQQRNEMLQEITAVAVNIHRATSFTQVQDLAQVLLTRFGVS